MTWTPTTDFEQEIVNLQPDHDFIFGALSEPQPQRFYPRPKSHIEYADTKRRQSKKQQEEYETTGRFNNRLHVISQVQRIAGTKPLGEQPTENDWDNDKDVETEVVALMRHFGLGPSVEEPLNEKVTIATYPVENGLKVMKTGRKTVPLLFDDNLFKLKPKTSSCSSSGGESQFNNSQRGNSAHSKVGLFAEASSSSISDSNDGSFHTSNNLNTFKTSNESLGGYTEAGQDRHTLLLQAERMLQYDKLQEVSLDDENMFPVLSNDRDSFKTSYNANMPHSACNTSYTEYISSPNNSRSDSYPRSKLSTSFLCRFIKSDDFYNDTQLTTSSLASTSSSTSPILPLTYADMAKMAISPGNSSSSKSSSASGKTELKLPTTSRSDCKPKISQSPHLRFYTPRKLYAMRHKNASLQ